jgi:hypothetical protein
MGVSGQRHAPAALYPRGKDPRYTLYRRLGGPQSRSGQRKNPFASAGDRTSIDQRDTSIYLFLIYQRIDHNRGQSSGYRMPAYATVAVRGVNVSPALFSLLDKLIMRQDNGTPQKEHMQCASSGFWTENSSVRAVEDSSFVRYTALSLVSFLFLVVLQHILEPFPPLYWGFLTHRIRHTVGLPWTSDQPVAESSTYTGQHNTTQEGEDKHSCPQRDSNPRSQQPSGRRPRPGVDNPVASRHKWRSGHGSAVTQPTFLQLVRQNNCQISL